jgi:hypothetical protein
MAMDPMEELAAELRARPPASLAQLDADQLHDLAQSVRAVRQRQAVQIEAAGNKALRHIPRVLRGPIRKAAGG